MDDGKSGAVRNEKNQQYVALPNTWQAENNRDMNEKMGYGNLSDLANCAHPPTPVHAAKNNMQLGPKSFDSDYNYNADR